MLAAIDGLLRCEGRFAVGRKHLATAALALVIAACGGLFGAAMGSYSGRPLQMLYSALKVPMLLTFSAAICLPSLFSINAVLGLRDDFQAVLQGILAAQGAVAIALAAASPLVAFAYVSGVSYHLAVLFSGCLFATSTLVGQLILRRHYRPLTARNRRHWLGWGAWLALYVFVGIQLAWVLRPFVGAPGMRAGFFREGAWSNAYVVVARTLLEALGVL